MRLSDLASLIRHSPDTGAGSGSPAAPAPETPEADPAAPPTAAPAPAAAPAEPTPPAAPAEPAQEAAPPEPDEDEDEAPKLTAEQYEVELAKTRKQAANYRVERNTLKARVVELEQQLVAAQAAPPAPQADPAAEATSRAEAAERRAQRIEIAAELGVSVATLKAVDALQAAADETSFRAALGTLSGLLSGATPPAPATPPNPTPPADPATPPSLNEQIVAAQKAGDVNKVLKLKAQKLHALPVPK